LCRSESEWESVLSRLIESPELRESVGKAAYEVVSKRYLTTGTGKDAIKFVLS